MVTVYACCKVGYGTAENILVLRNCMEKQKSIQKLLYSSFEILPAEKPFVGKLIPKSLGEA